MRAAKWCAIFRNNVGATKIGDRFIRYGLCEGSSDLIGWRKVRIEMKHVGTNIAQFVALECKRFGEKPTLRQSMFLDAVRRDGGACGIVRCDEDVDRIVGDARHDVI